MLLVMHVQVDSRIPQSRTFTGPYNLGHIELAEEHFAMLHNLPRHMLSVKNTQLGKDTDVGIIKTETLFEEGNNVCEVTQIRIVGNNFIDVVRVFDDFKTTSGRKPEFVCSQTGEANMFPR
jgi:hypothetical protein